MSLWYAGSAFALVLAATAFLYWVLLSNLDRENARFEADALNNVRLMLSAASPARSHLNLKPEADRELYIRLLDPRGTIVLETPGMRQVLPPPTPSQLKAARSVEGTRDEVRTRENGAFETVTAAVAEDGSPGAGFVQIAMNRGDDEALLAIYRRQMALVLGVALLATTAAGYFIARAGMRPIRQIGAVAAEIGAANLHERIPEAGLPAELSGLAQGFNAMLDRLQLAFDRITRFSDDVAHELRTPVHNLRGEIEVALARERTSDGYRRVLGSCLEECGRISRIIRSLLFLARADERSNTLQRESIDLGRELDAVREFYEPAATEGGVALIVRTAPGLTAHLDRTLFQQAVGNLLSNAITHTPAGGEIRMEAAQIGRAVRLLVADTGCGVAPEHLPHVFDRFYRADPARTGGEHVGLGLAVVRSIVERHGGQARIESAIGQGARVELIFPDPT